MSSYAMFVKNKLFSIIDGMGERKEYFVKNSDTDFVRTRKLTFEAIFKILLSIGSGSLNKELLEYLNYDLETYFQTANELFFILIDDFVFIHLTNLMTLVLGQMLFLRVIFIKCKLI